MRLAGYTRLFLSNFFQKLPQLFIRKIHVLSLAVFIKKLVKYSPKLQGNRHTDCYNPPPILRLTTIGSMQLQNLNYVKRIISLKIVRLFFKVSEL